MHHFFKIIEEILYKSQKENPGKNFVSHTLKAKEIFLDENTLFQVKKMKFISLENKSRKKNLNPNFLSKNQWEG